VPSSSETKGKAGASVIQQRSVISTGFPARYTVSLYQPPPATALFQHPQSAYAFGIIVTFYDRNNDEFFDIQTEPIIGFNRNAGVLYLQNSIKGGDGQFSMAAGYHLHEGTGGCASTDFLTGGSPEPTSESTTLVISGTTPALFDQIPDVACDRDQREWLGLCQAPIYRASCAGANPPPSYRALCDFCGGRWSGVNMELRDYSNFTDPQEPDPQEPLAFDDCQYDNPADVDLCLADRMYTECLERATTDEGTRQCEHEYNVAQCQALAVTDAERESCMFTHSDEGEEPHVPIEPPAGPEADPEEPE